MKRDDFLQKLDEINIWKKAGQRAVNKPLLLLFALGQVSREERLISYKTIDLRLKKLLNDFGPPRKTVHPEQPFGRLQADRLWEIPDDKALSRTDSGDLLKSELIARDVTGGFPPSLYERLRREPGLIQEAARFLLEGHFPTSLHNEIRAAVGIPNDLTVRETTTRARDPGFRQNVLRAYERRCTVCNFDLRMDDELFALEAAHIKWHAAGGPDTVPNGLALCTFHHKALDRGALGLKEFDEGFKVAISSSIHGQSKAIDWLRDFHDQPLRPPQNREFQPRPEFVQWHQEEVFRCPALGC